MSDELKKIFIEFENYCATYGYRQCETCYLRDRNCDSDLCQCTNDYETCKYYESISHEECMSKYINDNYNITIDKKEVESVENINKNKKEFTKEDLHDGMIVEIRNNDRFIVLNNCSKFIGLDGFNDVDDYLDDLTMDISLDLKEYDIMKVYSISNYIPFVYMLTKENNDDTYCLDLIWERKEK